MMRRLRILPILALVALVCSVGRAQLAPGSATAELAPLWDQAVKALKDNSPQEAARLFDEWITVGEKQGIQSPEAHYNLGLAEWQSKRPGRAVYHLMESARLRSSPLSALKALGTLDGIQHEIGIRDGVSDTFAFRLFFILNNDWIVALATLSLWLVVGIVLLWWLRGQAITSTTTALFSVALICTAIAIVGIVNRRYFSDFGVLSADAETVPLFKNPNNKDEDKLADLPAGTIVSVGPPESNFVQIVRPIAGWAPASGVKLLARD